MDLHDADIYSSSMEEQLPYHAINNEYLGTEILKEALLFMDEVLADNYQRMKGRYSYAIIDSISRDFDIANEDFDYDNEHLSVDNYFALYKMQFNDFKEEYLKKVTFDFDFQ